MPLCSRKALSASLLASPSIQPCLLEPSAHPRHYLATEHLRPCQSGSDAIAKRKPFGKTCTAKGRYLFLASDSPQDMPRHHQQRNGGGKGGQGNFATAWAKGDYSRAEGGGSSGDEDEGPGFSGRCSVPLAMWDLGQCDRKRYALHARLFLQHQPRLKMVLD
jgi:hypothetical protein